MQVSEEISVTVCTIVSFPPTEAYLLVHLQQHTPETIVNVFV